MALLAPRSSDIDAYVATGLYNGTYYPSGWSGKVGGHMPVLTLGGSDWRTATVTVGHGMSEAHYISAIWVEDQLGRPIFYQPLNWTDTPTVSFTVPRGVTHLTPFENCNLYDFLETFALQTSRRVLTDARAVGGAVSSIVGGLAQDMHFGLTGGRRRASSQQHTRPK